MDLQLLRRAPVVNAAHIDGARVCLLSRRRVDAVRWCKTCLLLHLVLQSEVTAALRFDVCQGRTHTKERACAGRCLTCTSRSLLASSSICFSRAFIASSSCFWATGVFVVNKSSGNGSDGQASVEPLAHAQDTQLVQC